MNLLFELYNIYSPSGRETLMMNFIRTRLDKLGVSHHTDTAGNIYATKGIAASYPCVISHTDEVHEPHTRNFKIRQTDDGIIFGFDYLLRSHCGIGADDKNGIWICLKCLELFDEMKCVFFVSEEVGCLGSMDAEMKFFDDCRYVLQCDRKGNRDMITSCGMTDLCSGEFLLDVNPGNFGYRLNDGLITDAIMLKKKGLQVSCTNISCGYYLPHTPQEFTCMEDLRKCLLFVRHIILNCRKAYPHQMIKIDERRYWQIPEEDYRFIPERNNGKALNTKSQSKPGVEKNKTKQKTKK
jgi:putative aminopeptidase FrvX